MTLLEIEYAFGQLNLTPAKLAPPISISDGAGFVRNQLLRYRNYDKGSPQQKDCAARMLEYFKVLVLEQGAPNMDGFPAWKQAVLAERKRIAEEKLKRDTAQSIEHAINQPKVNQFAPLNSEERERTQYVDGVREKIVENTHYDGKAYEAAFDYSRLQKGMLKTYECMKDGNWRTLEEIAAITGGREASESARLRDFRKERFGNHTVLRRARGNRSNGLFEYKLILQG